MNTPDRRTVSARAAVMDDAEPILLDAVFLSLYIIGLEEHHVTAIAASTFKKPSRRGAGLLWHNDLEDPITDCVQAVAQAEV